MLRQMARAVGDRHHEGESLGHLWYAHYMKHSDDHLALAQEYIQEALQLAHQTQNRQVFAKSLIGQGFVHQWHGKLPAADSVCAEALLISRQEGYQDSLAQSLVTLGI